jgi:hypothetical protein
LGVGLAILLVIIILGGMFFSDRAWMDYVLLGIATVIIIVVLVQTSGDLGWSAGYWWYDNWSLVAGVVVFLLVIAVIVGSSQPKPQTPAVATSRFLRDMFGK